MGDNRKLPHRAGRDAGGDSDSERGIIGRNAPKKSTGRTHRQAESGEESSNSEENKESSDSEDDDRKSFLTRRIDARNDAFRMVLHFEPIG